jgi:putative FmdB family regulatory protein
MPLYEYECDNGHRFEVIQRFSDPPVATCGTCEAPVRRLLSSPAIQFKGKGWYITDYARKGGADASKDAKDTKSSAAGDTAAKPAADTTAPKPSTTS